MQLNRRITNGLAWAGAILVVGVPVADFAARQFLPETTPKASIVQADAEAETPVRTEVKTDPAPEAKPVEVASVPQPAAKSGDAVESFLQSGRELPSYITGGDAPAQTPDTPKETAKPEEPAATTPAASAETKPAEAKPAETKPAEVKSSEPTVASLPPAKVAPVPMPASMRPPEPARPLIVEAPVQAPLTPAQPLVETAQRPVIIENSVDVVTAQELEDWESGPLSDFLANRNTRMAPPSSARFDRNYDPNGFFLDQGPNSSAQYRRFPRAYEDDETYFYD